MFKKKRRENVWKMGPPASYFEKHFETHPEHTRYLPEFKSDVTANPFHHPKPGKISRIEREVTRYPEDCYRWSKSDLRVVYHPSKIDLTIYPLDADTAGNVRYKKRS
jgi:hypothetical protein